MTTGVLTEDAALKKVRGWHAGSSKFFDEDIAAYRETVRRDAIEEARNIIIDDLVRGLRACDRANELEALLEEHCFECREAEEHAVHHGSTLERHIDATYGSVLISPHTYESCGNAARRVELERRLFATLLNDSIEMRNQLKMPTEHSRGVTSMVWDSDIIRSAALLKAQKKHKTNCSIWTMKTAYEVEKACSCGALEKAQ